MSLQFSLSTQPTIAVGATVPQSKIIFVNPGAAITCWSAGNDSNTGLSMNSPIATLAKAKTLWANGDTVRFAPGAVISEIHTWCSNMEGTSAPIYSEVINFIGDAGSPATFQGFDLHSGSWTNDGSGTNTYTTTFARAWYNTTSTPTGGPDQGMSFRMLIDTEQLKEVLLAATPVLPNQFTTQSACIAYVRANPGTFYVAGYNGSCMDKKWQQLPGGTYETIYVHAHDNLVPNSGGRKVSIGNRLMPCFNRGATIENINIVGGVGHNGVICRNTTMKNVKISHALHHATFMAGALMIDCEVMYGNKAYGGYAYHNFDVQNNPGYVSRLIRCKATEWNDGINAIIGGHGASNTQIIDALEADDFYAVNCSSLGGTGLCTYGMVFRNPTFINISQISAGSSNLLLINPSIINTKDSPIGANTGFQPPYGNYTLTVEGGFSTWGYTGFFQNSAVTSGVVNFNNHRILVKGDAPNMRWGQNVSTYTGALNFNNCIVACDTGDEASYNLGFFASTNITINATNSHFSGINLAGSNMTFNNVNSTIGGRSGLTRSIDDGCSTGAKNFADLLGYTVKGASNFAVNPFGQQGLYAYILTNYDVLTWSGGGLSSAYTLPTNAVFNGITHAYFSGGTNYVVIYGQAGVVYKASNGSGSFTQITGGPSKNWIGHVDTRNASNAGVIWLLADDNSVYKLDTSTNTFTAATTNPAFKCTGGFYDGTDIILWGGDATLGGAGTYGGIYQSTDSGVNFNLILDSTSTQPSGIGAFARKIKCGVKNNGVWTLMGANGTVLTGTKGWSGVNGSISGTTLTLAAAPTNGVVQIGDTITGGTTSGGTVITGITSSTVFTVNNSQTVTSTGMTGTNTKMSFTSRTIVGIDMDIMMCAHDPINTSTSTFKKILIAGHYQGGPFTRAQAFGIIDTSPSATDPSLWVVSQVPCPLESGIGAMTFVGAWYNGRFSQKWVIAGKVAELARSTDSKDWTIGRPKQVTGQTYSFVTKDKYRVNSLLPS